MAEVIVGESPGRGRGVFAARPFREGEIIEVCHIIVLSKDDVTKIDDTILYNYYFGWNAGDGSAAIALGYGSLYNHSDNPNARYHKHIQEGLISIVATAPVAEGDEILIRYTDPSGGSSVWFDVR